MNLPPLKRAYERVQDERVPALVLVRAKTVDGVDGAERIQHVRHVPHRVGVVSRRLALQVIPVV